MGIAGLFNIIRKYAPEQIMEYTLNNWSGNVFAVDISIFLNKFIKSAGDVLWMNLFFTFLCTLKKHKIKLICIFDGPNPPIEKKQEQQSRREQGQKDVVRLLGVSKLLYTLREEYNTEVPLEMQETAKRLLGEKDCHYEFTYWEDPISVIDSLTDLQERLVIRTAPITDNQRDLAWTIVNLMGIPSFQADGEAEALCAYLAIYGYVDAVLTEDSDVLAYGTPWMVRFGNKLKIGDEKVECIHLPSLLDALHLEMDSFRDLCILLSCDYNERVKGFPPKAKATHKPKKSKKPKKPTSIGEVGALAMIMEYGTIENCAPYIEDLSPLIYERCRELFTPVSSDQTKELIKIEPYNKKPEFALVKDFIQEYRLSISMDYIEKCWEPVKMSFYTL